MNEEIRDTTSVAMNLAKECGAQPVMRSDSDIGYEFYSETQIVAFYRAAYNKALEDAVKVADHYYIGQEIRALEMK